MKVQDIVLIFFVRFQSNKVIEMNRVENLITKTNHFNFDKKMKQFTAYLIDFSCNCDSLTLIRRQLILI